MKEKIREMGIYTQHSTFPFPLFSLSYILLFLYVASEYLVEKNQNTQFVTFYAMVTRASNINSSIGIIDVIVNNRE